MALFSKVLVANRGEIAIRVFRTLRELGIVPVAVYSEADRDALHVARRGRGLPDRARPGGGELPRRRADRRDRACGRAPRRSIPATASSPRTPSFARAVEESGLAWIGPPSAGDRADGVEDARRGRRCARPACRSSPGPTDPVETVAEVLRLGEEVGYPLIVKAAAGGGGKGMKLVAEPR